MTLSRRHLLAASALVAFLPGRAFASEGDMTEALLSLLEDRKTAAALGAIWLKSANQPRSSLLDTLLGRLRSQGWTGDADRGTLRNAMTASVADDYRTGDMIAIDGWQVAKTQAELCALAYLAQ